MIGAFIITYVKVYISAFPSIFNVMLGNEGLKLDLYLQVWHVAQLGASLGSKWRRS